MKKALICIIASLLTIGNVFSVFGYTAASETSDEFPYPYDLGHNGDHSYVNEYFGVQCQFPEDWFVYSDEMIDWKNGYDEAYIQQNGRDYYQNTLDWFEMEASNTNGQEMNVQLHRYEEWEYVFQNLLFSSIDEYAEQLIENVVQTLEQDGAKIIQYGVSHDIDFPADDYASVFRVYEYGGETYASREILMCKGHYFFDIVANAEDLETAGEMLMYFSALNDGSEETEDSTADKPDYKMGYNNGNQYINEYFGIQLTLPKEMIVFTNEMIDYDNGYDESYLQEYGRDYFNYLDNWWEMEAGNLIDKTASIDVTRLSAGALMALVEYPSFDEYAEVLINSVLPKMEAGGAANLEYTITHDVEIPLEKYADVILTYDNENGHIVERRILAIKNEYFLNLVISADDDEEAKALLERVSAVDEGMLVNTDDSKNDEENPAFMVSESGDGGYVYVNPILGIQCDIPETWDINEEIYIEEPSCEFNAASETDLIRVYRDILPLELNMGIQKIGLANTLDGLIESPSSLLGFEPDYISADICRSPGEVFDRYGIISFTGKDNDDSVTGMMLIKFTNDSMYLIKVTTNDQQAAADHLAELLSCFSAYTE